MVTANESSVAPRPSYGGQALMNANEKRERLRFGVDELFVRRLTRLGKVGRVRPGEPSGKAAEPRLTTDNAYSHPPPPRLWRTGRWDLASAAQECGVFSHWENTARAVG